MATGSTTTRSARSHLKRLVVGSLTAGLSVIVTLSSQPASACSMMPEPTVFFGDLTSVLETGGPITDVGRFLPEDPPPKIVGAIRIEVVEETPEQEEWYSGAVLQSTDLWGDADNAPAETIEPRRKPDEPYCDTGNAPALGESFYYLSTQAGDLITIVRPDDVGDTEIDTMLDEHFGAPFVVPDETGHNTTVDTVTVDSSEPVAVGVERPRTGPTTIWLIVGVVGTLIVGIGIGLALSSLLRLRRHS